MMIVGQRLYAHASGAGTVRLVVSGRSDSARGRSGLARQTVCWGLPRRTVSRAAASMDWSG